MGMMPSFESPRITGTSSGNANSGNLHFNNKWVYNGKGGYTPNLGPKDSRDRFNDMMINPAKYKEMARKRRQMLELRGMVL